MSAGRISMRDALYEHPGPKTRRRIRIATIISLLLLAASIVLIVRQFAITGQLDARYWSIFARATTWSFLGHGLLFTLQSALVAGAISIAMGLVLMLGRISPAKPLSAVAVVLIEFFRGVPSLLFIYFFFLVIPQYGIKLPNFWMITLPVAMSASGVVAEVLRAGVNAVPKGQIEAASSLGMRRRTVTWLIVLPQAIRFVVPTLISQVVIVLKDTTFAYIVSYADLMQNARVLVSNYDALVQVYFVAAIIYILINYLLNKLAVTIERRTGATIVR